MVIQALLHPALMLVYCIGLKMMEMCYPGDLILIDAGVEVESHYTADITRTFPVNGKFTEAQRKIYMIVYKAQQAGIAAVKPGAKFKDFHAACMVEIAKGAEELGVLPYEC